MAFKICEQPSTADLAITDPADVFALHAASLNAQHAYWSKKETAAQTSVDLALHAVANGIHKEIKAVSVTYTADALGANISSEQMERSRRRGLHILATSLLFRSIVKPNAVLQDGLALGEADLIIDMSKDEADMPLDARLHMLQDHIDTFLPTTTADVQWYRQGGLYVRRTIPPQPSDFMVLHLQEHEVSPPFNEMATLFPYVASKN